MAHPVQRQVCLPILWEPVAEVDVYVDDFIAVTQDDHQRLCAVCATVLHSIDAFFRPNGKRNSNIRAEPVSLKKLDKGDASWSTHKTILGWEIVDIMKKTISLPSHRKARLAEVLDSIQPHQIRISVTKWYKILGELCSMSLALPGSRGLFSSLEKALQLQKSKQVSLTMQDFRWILNNISKWPIRITEWYLCYHQPLVIMMPLALVLEASGSWHMAFNFKACQYHLPYSGDTSGHSRLPTAWLRKAIHMAPSPLRI